MNRKMNKKEELKRIIEKSKGNPKQRSEEWIKYRNTRIGGSEMHNICKLKESNINNFINNFLLNKIEKKKIFILPCEFGNLFENEIHKYTEKRFNTIIYDLEVIEYDKIKAVCYSADGISIINNKIILFEFKCPYSRIPTDKIKYDYECQINTGLNVIRECDKCYYCEGEFKKCKIKDLYNYNEFDKINHNTLIIRNFKNMYVTYGIIYIYTMKEDEEDNKIKDIGEYNKYKFTEVLNKIYKKEYKIMYFSELIKNKKIEEEYLKENKRILPYNNTKELPNEKLINKINEIFISYIKEKGGKPIGYIPWKLYNYNIIEQKKKINFFDENITKLIIYIGYILKMANTYENIKEKKKYIIKNKINIENLIN